MAQARAKKTITSDAQVAFYDVLSDGILGSTVNDGESQPHQWRILKGQVSGADLIAAGCDIEWLERVGQIRKIGFLPVNS